MDLDERITIIALLLLESENKLPLKYFTDYLYISRSTFLNDINKVKTYFNQYQINLETCTNGYYLNIDEQKRLDTICTTVFPRLRDEAYLNDDDFYINLINKILGINQIKDDILIIVNDTENAYGITISDAFFRQTVFSLSLLCKRLLNGKRIDTLSYIDSGLLNASVGKIADVMLKQVKKQYNINYGNNEVIYLAWRLHLCHFDILQNFEHSIDFYFYTEVIHFLSIIDKEINTDFLNDNDFTLMLTRHIWSIRNGNLGDFDFSNKELEDNYRDIYNIIKENIHIIETCIERNCSENELLSILLYVVTEIERKKSNKEKPKVIVLCHVGIGTAYYLADRLKETFNIDIIDVTSAHNLPQVLKRNDFDLIISTVKLEVDNIDYVNVSPSLEDSDIVAIQKSIANVQRNKNAINGRNRKDYDLSKTIIPECIIINKPCKDWKESISIAAKPLIDRKNIEPTYIQSIIDSINKNGPYLVFCKGVALLHAAPNNDVNNLCISIYRPKNPISYGHKNYDPVKLVIMVGVTDPNSQVGYIATLMKYLSNQEILNKILNAKNKKEIINILTQKENDKGGK